MGAARAKGGMSLAAETMVRLLSTDHLSDQMAALAWLQSQNFVQPDKIAVMGNSFGGIEVVLTRGVLLMTPSGLSPCC